MLDRRWRQVARDRDITAPGEERRRGLGQQHELLEPEHGRPRFDGADRLLLGRYRDPAGAEVDLAVGLYSTQERGRSLVGYGHGGVDPEGPWSWAANLPAPLGAQAESIVAPGAVSRTVLSFYTVGAMETGSAARVKLETLRHHLLGGSQRAAALLVSSEDRRGGRGAIERFLSALGPADKAIDQIAAGR